MKNWEIEKQPTPEYSDAPFDIVCGGETIAMHLSEERAKLIATAPEMLEALKFAANRLHKLRASGISQEEFTLPIIEAAIAKAEGTL